MSSYHTLIDYALNVNLIEPIDALYINNTLAHFIGVTPSPYKRSTVQAPLHELLDVLTQEALKTSRIEVGEEEHYQAALMDFFTPKPSHLKAQFYQDLKTSPTHATEKLYALMKRNGYIQEHAVKKNRHFSYDSPYGTIQCTINLSKPEKDPKVIAKLKEQKATSYPQGMLAKENMGYYGHLGYPGRANHRIIPLRLNDEPFFMQYSPYVYYDEHTIVFHESFIPMEISAKTWRRLFDFVDLLPQYFLGSNAGLPIVGGSILNHEHYQGGKATFPIDEADAFATYEKGDITLELLKWPVSVIRIKSHQRASLLEFVEKLRLYYESYSDEDCELLAHTTEPHNAINPIVRKVDETYVVLMALRNNRTTKAYPDGLFHVHEDVYPIKKENIGLIEVMGLAILPPRHQQAIKDMVAFADGTIKHYEHQDIYEPWAKHFGLSPTKRSVEDIEDAMARTFVKGLEDVGVFKQTATGKEAFKRFVESFLKTQNTL